MTTAEYWKRARRALFELAAVFPRAVRDAWRQR